MDRKVRCSALRCCLFVLVACCLVPGASAQLISEFEPNPPGTDPATMSIEISGTPMAAFTGVVLSIESDSGTSIGFVDRSAPVSGSFDVNGLLTVTIPDLENPSFTLVLLDTWSGAIGDDIDTNDDGTPDNIGAFGTVYDAIGIPDTAGDAPYLYGAALGGADFVYPAAPPATEPEISFRDFSTGVFYSFYPDTVTPPGKIYGIDGTEVLSTSFIFGDPSATSFGALNPSVVIPVELMTFDIE